MSSIRVQYTCTLLAPKMHCSIQHQQKLLGPILKAGRLLGHSCKGLGTCGACMVWVIGDISPATARELRTLRAKRAQAHERLACVTQALGPVTIWTASWGPKEQ